MSKPIMKTWRRDDENHLIHDGDCYFWDRRVCTCGLLHHLRPMTDRALELIPDFYKQDAAQHLIMDRLLSSKLVEAANKIMAQPGRELTDEERAEIDKIFKDIGIGRKRLDTDN